MKGLKERYRKSLKRREFLPGLTHKSKVWGFKKKSFKKVKFPPSLMPLHKVLE